MVEDKEFAAKLGKQGRAFIEESGLSQKGWDSVIDGLLSPITDKALVAKVA